LGKETPLKEREKNYKKRNGVSLRGNVWWYEFMIDGDPYRRPIPEAKTITDAKKAMTKARAAVLNGTYESPIDSPNFREFAEQVYLLWARQNKRSDETYKVAALVEYFGNKQLSKITTTMIEKYMSLRKNGLTRYKRVRSAASVNRELTVLSSLFTLAIREKVVRKNPAAGVKKYHEDNKRIRFLLPEEETRLLAQCKDERAYLRPVIILAIHTGLRRGEILKLAKSDVDLFRNVIHVRNTKNGKDRLVQINKIARAELLNLVRQADKHEYLFQNPKTNTYTKDVKHAFQRAREDAKLVNFRFHDLRHTFGSRLAEMGVDSFTIMELMRHSDLRMTERYVHATDPRKRQAVAQLENYGDLETNFHKFSTTGKKRKA
jgi:integrase